MKTLLSILIIAFYSCTSSGKLTDAEFPYHIHYGKKLTSGQLNATYTGTPTNVGSYSVIATITNAKYKNGQDNIIKYALIFAGIALSILLAVFLFIRNRDEEITLPDDEDNFPPLDNAFGVNNPNSIFKL